MTTQIEILNLSSYEVEVAFYYSVTKIAGTADGGRIPKSVNVQNTPIELAAFRNGTLIEIIKTLVIFNLSTADKAVLVEKAWIDGRERTIAEHRAKFKDKDLIGKWFDGTRWN